MRRPFTWYHVFLPCDLELEIWPTLEKLYHYHNSNTTWGRAFKFHMCIPYDKTFIWYHNLWPSPWSLTYLWKTLILAITQIPTEAGLSYFKCVFLMTRPFTLYHVFWPCNLDLEVWPTVEKTLTLAITQIPWEIGHSYLTCVHCIPYDKTFYMVPYFFLAWRALFSSDNSY